MNLLLTGAFRYTDDQIKSLKSLGFNITYVQNEREPINIDCTIFDAVVCNSLFLYNHINNFNNLKFIQATSAGLDRLPLNYITRKSIILKNAKGVYSVPMAEWCMTKILDIYKNTKFFFDKQNECAWEKNRELLELNGSCAAIIGAGDIGTQVAKRLKAFDVSVAAVDLVKPLSHYYDAYYHIDNIEDIIKKSDIVIITLPLTELTKNLFDRELLFSMKPNSIIINMSRGGIIDEKCLVQCLKTKKIKAAALDVFENEPLDSQSELWNIDNLYISPHNSFVSPKNIERLFSVIYNNLKEFINMRGQII